MRAGPPVFAGDVALRTIEQDAGVVTMTFDAPPAFAAARAGQFLLASSLRPGAPVLARPMSILGAAPLTIAFGWQGEGTRALSEAVPGEAIHLVGPLGWPFEPLPADALLVVEGAHFGTLLALAAELGRADVLFVTRPPDASAGPVSAGVQDAALMQRFAAHASVAAVERATLPSALEARRPPAIAAGASDAAMAAVQAFAAARGVPGQAALQTAMPCGLGACQACVRPFRDGTLRLVCDGPVFPLDAPDFGPAPAGGAR